MKHEEVCRVDDMKYWDTIHQLAELGIPKLKTIILGCMAKQTVWIMIEKAVGADRMNEIYITYFHIEVNRHFLYINKAASRFLKQKNI